MFQPPWRVGSCRKPPSAPQWNRTHARQPPQRRALVEISTAGRRKLCASPVRQYRMVSASLRRKASQSTHPLFFHAAQVRIGGAVVATAHNTSRYSLCAAGHAEVRACRAASRSGRSLAGAVVVSIRVTRAGKLANAKPCARCEAAMRTMGVKRVVYSTVSGGLEEIRLRHATSASRARE